MGDLSKNFSRAELVCSCGCKDEIINFDFIERLQKLRSDYGKPMVVNSWYRCKPYNAKIGGSKNSQHCRGIAVDIAVDNAVDRMRLVRLACKHGFSGVGIYASFVHIDARTSTPVLWQGQ